MSLESHLTRAEVTKLIRFFSGQLYKTIEIPRLEIKVRHKTFDQNIKLFDRIIYLESLRLLNENFMDL